MADVKETVRIAYGQIARGEAAGCCEAAGCGPDEVSRTWGYSAEDIAAVPEGANLGLGCGNPLALGELNEGDAVLDLGSGGGFDCFLAARRVGPSGRVIGVDMTPDMIERARGNAAAGGYENVDFRLGELEDLPVDDDSVDLVISNCVINLVPDRLQVYREAFRVLKPGGRFAVSDTLVAAEVPAAVLESPAAKVACLSAQGTPDDYVRLIEKAGFVDVRIVEETHLPPEMAFEDSLVEAVTRDLGVDPAVVRAAARSMVSVSVVGRKP